MAKKNIEFKRTIAPELFDQWERLKRKGDANKIVDKCKAAGLTYSKTTIDRAIIWGNVNNDDLIDVINEYFKERIERQRQQAEELKEL